MHDTAIRNPAVSIIIISYNTRDLTLACIRSIRSETKRTPFEVIVFDNASSDGSLAAVKAAFPDVKAVQSRDNLGFAKGVNEAARHATGLYLLLLNPDTVVLEGAIDRLLEFSRECSEAKIWGGVSLNRDRSLNYLDARRFSSLWGFFCRLTGLSSFFVRSAIFNPDAYLSWDRGSKRHVDIISGSFLCIRHQFWKTLGGFDERFFMYGEESDLCLRAAELGARPCVTPHARVIHDVGASQSHEDRLIAIQRSKVIWVSKHWRGPRRWLGLFMLRTWPVSKALGGWLLSLLPLSRDSRQNLRARSSTWYAVWCRRKEWLVSP